MTNSWSQAGAYAFFLLFVAHIAQSSKHGRHQGYRRDPRTGAASGYRAPGPRIALALRLRGGESTCGKNGVVILKPLGQSLAQDDALVAGVAVLEKRSKPKRKASAGPVTTCLLRRCVPDYDTQRNLSEVTGCVWDGRPAAACKLCGVKPMHRCAVCGSSAALSSGATTQDTEKRWLAFLCQSCTNATQLYTASLSGSMSANTSNSFLLSTLKSGDVSRWCLVCNRLANYGPSGAPLRNASLCSRHKEAHFVDLLHPLCSFPDGCSRRPAFADPNDSKRRAVFCSQHRPDRLYTGLQKLPAVLVCRDPWTQRSLITMSAYVDVTHRRCQAPGCCRTASYAPAPGALPDKDAADARRALFCAKHKRQGDIPAFFPRCGVAGCSEFSVGSRGTRVSSGTGAAGQRRKFIQFYCQTHWQKYAPLRLSRAELLRRRRAGLGIRSPHSAHKRLDGEKVTPGYGYRKCSECEKVHHWTKNCVLAT